MFLYIPFSVISHQEKTSKNEQVENSAKKHFNFQPVFGCTQHPKAGQNTQHLGVASRFCGLTEKNVKLQLIWHSLPSNQDWLGIMLRKQLVKHIFDTKSSLFIDFASSLIIKGLSKL